MTILRGPGLRWYRGPTLVLALSLGLSGCQGPPAPVPPPSENLRENLGIIGVTAVNRKIDEQFATPLRGSPAAAAASGGLRGAVGGAIQGASMVSPGGPNLITGMALIVAVPVGAIIGALTAGAAYGAEAVPEETAQQIEAQISEALLNETPHSSLRDSIFSAIQDEIGRPAVLMQDIPEVPASGKHDYRGIAPEGVDTILEVSISRIGLAGSRGSDPQLLLFMEGQARLVRVRDLQEIYEKSFWHIGGRRTLRDWGRNNAASIARAFNDSYTALAETITEEVFLLWHNPKD